MTWSEWALRDALAVQPELAAPHLPIVDAPPLLNPGAIAKVLGLAAQSALVRSAEPLTLRASFVSLTGESRALLAGANGERIYQMGENLPGGSVLRRVEITQVVLWRNGREEVLPLQLSGGRSLQALKAGGQNPGPTPSPIHLRSTADLRQSN